MIKTKQVPGLKVVPPKRSAFELETDENLPRLHCQFLIVGRRGSGKTTACINLIERCKFDLIVVVSPTFNSNREIMSRLKIDPANIISDMTPAAVARVKQIVEKERDDLVEYRNKLKLYNEARARIRKAGDDDMSYLWDYIAADGSCALDKPTHRWGGKVPRCCCIIDDAIGSELYSRPRALNNLAILHRHLGQFPEGGSIGISLFYLVQSYRTCAGGLTRCIRNNTTGLIAFLSKNSSEVDEMEEELASECGSDFRRAYEYATAEGGYNFLTVDLHPKKPYMMYRKNLDTFLILDDDAVKTL